MQGHRYSKELDNGQLFVQQQLVAQSGSSMPNWLAQNQWWKDHIKTMHKFRALLE